MTGTVWRVAAALAVSAVMGAGPATAGARCELQQVAALPISISGGRVLIDARIDGQPVKVIVDTGAQTSLVFAGAARRLGLPTSDVSGARMYGAGGEVAPRRALLRTLSLAGADIPDVMLWVAGEGDPSGAAMLLGQDVLSHWDVEYDLAHTAIRLLHPVGCHGDAVVYWSETYAKTAMLRSIDEQTRLEVAAVLNGATVRATLDTGAPTTVVTPVAAAQAHAAISSSPTPHDEITGLGPGRSAVRLASFETVSVGGEVIQHPRLRVSDIFGAAIHDKTGSVLGEREDAPDMLIGLDFLMAHRLLVAPDQGMVYFTYAGGPVFAPIPAAAAATAATGAKP